MNIGTVLSMGYTIAQTLNFLTGNFPKIGKKIKEAQKLGYDVEKIVKSFSNMNPEQLEQYENSKSLDSSNPWISAAETQRQGSAAIKGKEYLKTGAKLAVIPLAAYGLQRYLNKSIQPPNILEGNPELPAPDETLQLEQMPPEAPSPAPISPEPIQPTPQPQPPINPGSGIGQQVQQQAQSPVIQAKQPASAEQMQQAAQAMPSAQAQQVPIFEQLLGGVDPSKLEPAKQDQLKFLSMISDQLQSKGKTLADPEFKNLAKKIKSVIAGNPGMMTQELGRFPKEQANVNPLDIEESVKNHPLFEELKTVGSEISSKGMVKLYHRTTSENADKIKNSGVLKTKENAAFFSTKRDGQNEGYGDEVVEFEIPINKLQLDDVFGDEAHVRIDLGNKRELNVKDYLKKQPVNITEPTKITKPQSIQKGESVVTEDGNIAEIKGVSGNNFLIEENGKVRQVPMDSLRAEPEAIKKAKIVFDPSKVSESDRSAALAISLPMPDKSAIINMFHDGSFYMYKRKDGKPIEDSIIQRIIEGQDIPMSTGETFMGAWNQDTGDSRGSASFKELTALAQDASKPDDPTKPLIFHKITNGYVHGYITEFMKSLKESNRMFSAKPKKIKK